MIINAVDSIEVTHRQMHQAHNTILEPRLVVACHTQPLPRLWDTPFFRSLFFFFIFSFFLFPTLEELAWRRSGSAKGTERPTMGDEGQALM
jgi:hypothetical protein